MLKLGGYGLYRINLILLKKIIFNDLFRISLMGGIIVSFICIKQQDVKAYIAYSSVRHMSFVIARFFYQRKVGASGSLSMIISHGLCSSCLFYMANLFYEQISSRNIFILRGLFSVAPVIRYF